MQITPHLPNIVKLISTNATVSIVAPTGSGKSVAVPAAIASAGARCFVTVPTRTAALSLTEYQRLLQQASSPGIDVTKIVGYAAEGNVNYGPSTMVAYVTGGHARRKMLSYFSGGMVSPINFCDVLMVDEVHSGSLDTTIIISLWMKAAALGVPVPRLVIASATPVPIPINPPPAVYTVELVAFPIEFRYLTKDFDIDDPNGLLYSESARVAANIHKETPIETGHILIFAPGSAEVESVTSSLKELLQEPIQGKTVSIIPAFGALKQEDIALIYKETGPDERKIVIATNIAEMSITISDVGHVIDTMVEKRAETSQSGGFRLTTHYISKDSAKQRAGRTGRTRQGICYRMCTEQLYNSLEQHRPPEIQRIPIYETVIELLDVGLSPETVIQGIDTQRVLQAVQVLNTLGMVTNSPTGLIVTELGHFAPKFPISVRNAAFLWKWMNYSGRRYSPNTIKAGHERVNINLEDMEIDETSEYSTIRLYHMDQITSIFQAEGINPSSIIDATANVGGDSINFLRNFPNASLIAIELDTKIARILRRNFENIAKILGTNYRYNVTAINMSAVDYFKSNRYADLIFFDPPWTGRDYILQDKLSLELDGQGIGILIGNILRAGMTNLVLLKVPINADIEKIMTDINLNVDAKSYDVFKDNSTIIDYRLIFIRSNEFPLLSPTVMTQNVPTEVQLVQAGYPAFPGIVVAALIDCYGPSYFWIPRRKSDTSLEEHNIMVKEYKAKHFSKYIGYNDLETSLNMWTDLMKTTGGIHTPQRTIIKWSRDNSINNKKIRELLMIIEQCINAANRQGYQVDVAPFTTQGVMNAARPLLLSVYSDMTLIHRRDITYFSPITREDYRLDTRDAVNRLTENPPKGIISLSTAEIKTQRGAFRVIGFGVDTDKDGLGRPIVEKGQPVTARGPRAITRQRQTPLAITPSPQTDLTDVLGLLEGLNLGSPQQEPNTNLGTATQQPRLQPTQQPRLQPTQQPRLQPTQQPRLQATQQPRLQATQQPRLQPTQQPRLQPIIQSADIGQTDINAALDLLGALDFGTVDEATIDREYTRYWYIIHMQEFIEREFRNAQAYEVLNSLERWLIGLANIKSNPDPIFSMEKLEVTHPLSVIFVTELERKKIGNAGTVVGTCIAIARQFLEVNKFNEAPKPEINGDDIIVGQYSRRLPPGRLNILLGKANITEIATMALRYSCLLPRGQQWNIPLPVYDILVNRYGVTIEGFGSPINSQIIAINPGLKFCSLFLDTDIKFGSLGSFFDQKFNNVKVMANPPYVPDIMDRMARFLIETLDEAENMTVFITVPAWTDAEFYQLLSNTKYLKHTIQLSPNDHYYVDSNNNDTIIRAKFRSTIFILSKGYADIDYLTAENEIRAVYRNIKY